MTVGQGMESQTPKVAKPEGKFPVSGLETVEEGFFTVDHDLKILYVEATPNGRLWKVEIDGQEQYLGKPGQNLYEVFTGALRPPLFAAYKRLLAGENSAAWEVLVSDTRYVFRAFAITGGFATYYRAFSSDHREVERLITVSEGNTLPDWVFADTDEFFTHSADVMCVLDEKAQFERINPTAERLFGSGILDGRKSFYDVMHPDDRLNAEKLLFPPLAMMGRTETETFGLLCRCRSTTGEYRWLQWSIAVAYRKQRRFYATARDITVIKTREEEMSRQVQHDPLTGLPNRLYLNDRLHYCLAAASRRRQSVGVLFLDLDRFKHINDTFGHPAGDQLLSEIANRMRLCLRDEDMVARLGGDEFVVILPQIRDKHDAIRVAQKLLSRFVSPFDLRGNQVMLSVSIGICMSPQHGQTAEELIQHADEAMYRAKKTGRGCFALYDATLGAPARALITPAQFEMEARLSQAIDREELSLHYQPQVDLRRGKVIGVEALMRWHPVEAERVSPATFIPLAEESGLITRLGAWAVQEACRQAVDWYHSGFAVQMSVNLSASELSEKHFVQKLEHCLRNVGLPPHLVDLELTERTFIHNDEKMIAVLNDLHDLGLHLSVDDFGTKYSWLPYLRSFPIDGVKVDRSFISNILANPSDQAVVKAIINLSHTLGLKVIAEGVETPEQRDILYALGCDVMQGHLFSEALPPADVAPLLRQGR